MGLTVITAVVVAVVGHALGLPWAVAGCARRSGVADGPRRPGGPVGAVREPVAVPAPGRGPVDGGVGGDNAGQQLRDLLAQATEAEREAVMQARLSGDVSPAAADEVMFDVEARALRYDS